MMKTMIIGYGKMGKLIESLLLESGHEVSKIIDRDNADDLKLISNTEVDVAIEFSTPQTAFDNICSCIKKGIPVVSGTTAWLDKMDEVETLCLKYEGAFFYAPNFSIGVNLFFKACETMAKLMNPFEDYDVSIQEIHHLQKLDAPSGTAIATSNAITSHLDRKQGWSLDQGNENEIWIDALREPDVPGTHSAFFKSDIDTIEFKHTAHNRKGFASGAIRAAEWLVGKKGVFNMKDLLNL